MYLVWADWYGGYSKSGQVVLWTLNLTLYRKSLIFADADHYPSYVSYLMYLITVALIWRVYYCMSMKSGQVVSWAFNTTVYRISLAFADADQYLSYVSIYLVYPVYGHCQWLIQHGLYSVSPDSVNWTNGHHPWYSGPKCYLQIWIVMWVTVWPGSSDPTKNIESNYFIQYNSRDLKLFCSVNE